MNSDQRVTLKKPNETIYLSKEIIFELIKHLDQTTLSERSKNTLKNHNCFRVGDIIHLNKNELLRSHNCGIKSLREIENYLLELGVNFGDTLEPWNENFINSIEAKIFQENKLIKEEELIKTDQYLENEINRIINEAVSKNFNEKENKINDILNNRFGLDGTPAKTLEVIGQKYNVTRERIRQIQNIGLKKLSNLKPFRPISDKIFNILLNLIPISEKDFNEYLKEKNLTKQDWDFQGLHEFYSNFSLELNFTITKINGINIIAEKNLKKILNHIFSEVNKNISSTGLFSIKQCMGLKEVYLNNISEEIIKKILQTKFLFTWLDEDHQWFTYFSQRNRLINLITKAAAVSEKINVNDLYNKIKKYHRIDKQNFCSLNIFISFCLNSFDCDLNENLLILKDKKSKLSGYVGYKGSVIAPNERKIIDIFNKFGPILLWNDLKERLSNLGLASIH